MPALKNFYWKLFLSHVIFSSVFDLESESTLVTLNWIKLCPT